MLSLCMLLAAVLLTGCSDEPKYTDQQRTCIAKQYKDYDAKQMSQSVNVCKSCMAATRRPAQLRMKGAR